ncbi:MAG: hypothetical protein ACPGVB_09080 [Chitinophagales bacterium]
MKQLILFVSFFALLSLNTLQAQNNPTAETTKTAAKCQSSKEDKCCSFSCCSLADIQKFCKSSLGLNKNETVAKSQTTANPQPIACTSSPKAKTTIAKASFASSLSQFCPPGCCSMPCCKSSKTNDNNATTELVEVSQPMTK